MDWTVDWRRLRKDLLAGLTVAAISLPQAMAYALIAGLDPRYGLYSAIVVTAVASVFGSSAHLINGPTNAISLVVFSALAFLGPGEPLQAAEAAFLLAVMVGLVQCLVAVCRLGDLTRYLSDSVVLGFMTGAGVLIALSQVGNMCGLTDRGSGHHHLIFRLWLTVTQGGPLNFRAVALGLGTVVLVVGLRQITRRYHLPRVDMLLALTLAGIVARALGWSDPGADGKPLVAVVGAVPASLPGLHIPQIEWDWVSQMGGSAVAIAFLGLVEAFAISKSIAHRTRQPLDYNRQALAEGLANLAGGFFRCLPGSGSLTRSAINFHAGAVTRWSGVFAAGAVALAVVLFAPLAHYIPKAALAGILLVTAAGLVDWQRFFYAMRASRYDAGLILATAIVCVFFSVEYSILIGVGLSILMFVPRAAQLKVTELALAPGRVIRDRQPSDPPCSLMALVDLEGEMFFGAAPELDRCFEDLRRRTKAGARILVLRLKRTRNPDMVCMEMFQFFLREMQELGVIVLLCGIREDFAQAMRNLHFSDWLPADLVFQEKTAEDSSTLEAIRHAYELLGSEVCATCPRRGLTEAGKKDWYYLI
jgi:SulP family sulfate permease